MPTSKRRAGAPSSPVPDTLRGDRTKVLSVRLTNEELEALTARAIEMGVGPSTLARTLVRRGLGISATDVGVPPSAAPDLTVPPTAPPSELEARLVEHLVTGLAARVEALERWVAEH
ncbi:hypothetical protein GCM10027039_29410 [Terrabacter koreensis]